MKMVMIQCQASKQPYLTSEVGAKSLEGNCMATEVGANTTKLMLRLEKELKHRTDTTKCAARSDLEAQHEATL